MTNQDIAAIKRDYDRDGFVILRGYLEGSKLDELRERATTLSTALFDQQRKRPEVHQPPGNRPSREHNAKARRFGNVFKNLHKHDAWFDHQLNSGDHVPLVKALVEDELEPANAAWFSKRIGTTDEIRPHRDAIGRPQGPYTGAVLWIALDPAGPENGCLHYGVGSHKLASTPGIYDNGFDTEGDQVVPATVEPGDAVIHDVMTVHWSNGNPTDQPRRAVSFFYWGASGADKSKRIDLA